MRYYDLNFECHAMRNTKCYLVIRYCNLVILIINYSFRLLIAEKESMK